MPNRSRQTTATTLALAALTIPVLILGSCAKASSEADPTKPNNSTTVITRVGSTILVSRPAGAYLQALLTGTLTKGPGGCLYVEADGARALVLWRHGTTLSEDGQSVSNDGKTITIGDHVEIGGGFVNRLPAAVLPTDCDGSSVFSSSAP